jgi:glycosyltransferase involved in cell wall biosynthesis
MRTAFLIPAYQAEKTLGNVVQSLFAAAPADQDPPLLLVVDDGSTDRTHQIAEAAGVHVVRHAVNRGKGAALRTGLARLRDLGVEAAVTVDADGQHPADEAFALARHPAKPSTLLLGVRDLVRDGAPGPSRFSNGFSNVFLSAFSGRKLRDTQCGLRRYPVVPTLELGVRADGYAFEAEVILRAARLKWQIEELFVRVIYPPKAERISHFHVVRDPAKIVFHVLHTVATAKGPR